MKKTVFILVLAAIALNVSAFAATNRLGSIRSSQYVVTSEDDPTVPSWAKQPDPPQTGLSPSAVTNVAEAVVTPATNALAAAVAYGKRDRCDLATYSTGWNLSAFTAIEPIWEYAIVNEGGGPSYGDNYVDAWNSSTGPQGHVAALDYFDGGLHIPVLESYYTVTSAINAAFAPLVGTRIYKNAIVADGGQIATRAYVTNETKQAETRYDVKYVSSDNGNANKISFVDGYVSSATDAILIYGRDEIHFSKKNLGDIHSTLDPDGTPVLTEGTADEYYLPIDATNGLITASDATNAAAAVVAATRTAYATTNAIVSLNQSVQYVVANGTPLSIVAPAPETGGIRDWLVYVNATADTPLDLSALSGVLASDASATNAAKANAVTMLAFTEMTNGVYILGRSELKPVK